MIDGYYINLYKIPEEPFSLFERVISLFE